jgi:hypothetical protein
LCSPEHFSTCHHVQPFYVKLHKKFQVDRSNGSNVIAFLSKPRWRGRHLGFCP